jgi:hypothetical protein
MGIFNENVRLQDLLEASTKSIFQQFEIPEPDYELIPDCLYPGEIVESNQPEPPEQDQVIDVEVEQPEEPEADQIPEELQEAGISVDDLLQIAWDCLGTPQGKRSAILNRPGIDKANLLEKLKIDIRTIGKPLPQGLAGGDTQPEPHEEADKPATKSLPTLF